MKYLPIRRRVKRRDPLERFMDFVSPEPNTGCWLWMGQLSNVGYGLFNLDYRIRNAHRVAYELVKGAIPDGLVLDHLCRVPSCVNPDHLEPVAQRENVLRGISLAACRAAMTHCLRGHVLSEENLYRYKTQRRCKTCFLAWQKQKKQKTREALNVGAAL